jgi:hypothetical protein
MCSLSAALPPLPHTNSLPPERKLDARSWKA